MTVVEHLQPRAVLVENVPDLPRWDDGAVLIGFFESLALSATRSTRGSSTAFRHGVPQHRARLFIVGLARRRCFDGRSRPRALTTLRDAIGDLPPVPGGAARGATRPTRPRREPLTFQRRCGAACPEDERRRSTTTSRAPFAATTLEAFALLGEGQTYARSPDAPAALPHATSSRISTSG